MNLPSGWTADTVRGVVNGRILHPLDVAGLQACLGPSILVVTGWMRKETMAMKEVVCIVHAGGVLWWPGK
jgi:hypothetical protein